MKPDHLIMFCAIVTIIVVAIVGSIIQSNNNRRKKANRIEGRLKVLEQDNDSNRIAINHYRELVELAKKDDPFFDTVHRNALDVKRRFDLFSQKYSEEIAYKMLRHEYWVGMTLEQLLETKGRPDKIEKEEMKTKTKIKYIYGNKTSGDVFVIENDVVVSFKDR